MRFASVARYGVAAAALCGMALLGLSATAPPAHSQSNLIQDGKIGFVVSDIRYALVPSDDGACPSGLSLGPRDIFAATPEGARHDGESDADYTRRLGAGAQQIATAPNGQNLCMNPEAGSPDPNHHVVTGNVPVVGGLNLDGQNSTANGRAAPGTCAHQDFRGAHGETGIDNQFYRAVGCTPTFQTGGQANGFSEEMLTGAWGILIQLEDVQDLRNDNSVIVRIAANADPIQLSPNREPLPNSTYAMDQDPRYQATTHGRIVNGVLTTDPIDTRGRWVVNNIRLDRPLNHARLRMTIAADGAMEGYMAGYAPVEEIYDTVFGFRSGRDATGQPAPLRLRQGSANGYAFTARHTCNGVYFALRQMADGDRDPATGQCNSISMQYSLKAIPAFIVNQTTTSTNSDLVGRETGYATNPAAPTQQERQSNY